MWLCSASELSWGPSGIGENSQWWWRWKWWGWCKEWWELWWRAEWRLCKAVAGRVTVGQRARQIFTTSHGGGREWVCEGGTVHAGNSAQFSLHFRRLCVMLLARLEATEFSRQYHEITPIKVCFMADFGGISSPKSSKQKYHKPPNWMKSKWLLVTPSKTTCTQHNNIINDHDLYFSTGTLHSQH